MRQSVSDMLHAFWGSSFAQELRQAKQCHRELEFNIVIPSELLPGEPRCIAGKIDCLFESAAGEWVIFDYKTGDRFAGKDPAELLRHYEFQLGVYAWAVRKGLGISPAQVAVVTFRPQVTLTVWPVSDRAIDQIQARAVEAIVELIRTR